MECLAHRVPMRDPGDVAAGSPLHSSREKTRADPRRPANTRPSSVRLGFPHFRETAEDLHRIAVPTWIVDADHDEAIKRRPLPALGREDWRELLRSG